MLFITPIINAFMWIGYLVGAFIVLWGFVPTWGGWRSLDYKGKAIAIGGAIVCVLCGYGLLTTVVITF